MPPPAAVPLAGGGGRCARWVGLTSARRWGARKAPAPAGSARHARRGCVEAPTGSVPASAGPHRRCGHDAAAGRRAGPADAGGAVGALLAGGPAGRAAVGAGGTVRAAGSAPPAAAAVPAGMDHRGGAAGGVAGVAAPADPGRPGGPRGAAPAADAAPAAGQPPQGLLSGLVGAAVVALTTAASRGTAPAAPPPAVAAPAPPPPGLPGAVLATAQPAGPADRMDPAVGSLTSQPSGDHVAAAFGTGPAAATVDAAVYGRRPWRAEGVELPGGGWVDRDTAAAAAAAAALLWLRRRRRYLPRPPSRSAREDADLAALPNTVAAILQAGQDVEPDAPHTPSPDADSGGALRSAPPTPAAGITPPAAGAAGSGGGWDRPLTVADLPPGGVGVVGPAAADALRGILTTALLSNDSDQTVLVSTTAADLDTLLGGGPVSDRPPAGMAVYSSIEQLLAAAETHLLNNPTSGLAGPGPQPAPTRADAATAQPAPPARLLLVTSCPAQVEAARRLALLLTHPAARPGLTAVLLGRWPYGTTWQVEPGGHIHPHPPPPPPPPPAPPPAARPSPPPPPGHRQPPPGQRRICVLPPRPPPTCWPCSPPLTRMTLTRSTRPPSSRPATRPPGPG